MSGNGFNFEYDCLARFCSYYHQIDAVQKLEPNNICMIGVQNGVTTWYLRKMGFDVTTVDINPKNNPDVVATVERLPFKNGRFDTVCAFEVLEHLPFKALTNTIKEMKRVSQRFIVISLPNHNIRLRLWFPIIHNIIIPLPLSNPSYLTTHEHFWEIDSAKETKLGNILSIMEEMGLQVLENYDIPDNPYHHMFICKHSGR